MQDNKDTTQDMWNEVDMMLPSESPRPDKPVAQNKPSPEPDIASSGTPIQENVNELNKDLFPPVPESALVDDIQAPSDVLSDVQRKEHEETRPETEQEQTQDAAVLDTKPLPPIIEPALPEYKEGCYAKPKKYRPSIKAFYPHLGLMATTLILAMFPSLAAGIFSQDDLAQLPEFLQTHLKTLIQVVMLFCCLLLGFVVFRQKMTGTILVYGDYLEYKKGLLDKTTIHYADIRTIDVRRCLATAYSPVGDFHIISSRNQHVVLQNLLDPFRLKDAILSRKKELNI